jgi:DNA-binding FadR family transcriptional regulator
VNDEVPADGARRSALVAVQKLGARIVGRDPYRADDVLRLEQVAEELDISRAMAREVLQILSAKGLVTLQPRVGATVRPLESWNLFDPQVIKWRLEVAPRFQMRSLTELRAAIEPRAAYLAASRASADVCRDLVSLVLRFVELGLDEKTFRSRSAAGERHRREYGRVDGEFHEVLLRGSQNELFYGLAHPIRTALDHRIQQEWDENEVLPGTSDAAVGERTPFPSVPQPAALWFHFGLAYAIDQGRPKAAETFSRAIMAEILEGPLADAELRRALGQAVRQISPSGLRPVHVQPFQTTVLAISSDER